MGMEVWELGDVGGGDNSRHKDSVCHEKRKDQGWNLGIPTFKREVGETEKEKEQRIYQTYELQTHSSKVLRSVSYNFIVYVNDNRNPSLETYQ